MQARYDLVRLKGIDIHSGHDLEPEVACCPCSHDCDEATVESLKEEANIEDDEAAQYFSRSTERSMVKKMDCVVGRPAVAGN